MKALDKALKILDSNYKGNKKITLYLDDDNNHMEEILNDIKNQSQSGHCLQITLDQGKEKNQNFEFDGDGMDSIYEIEVE